VIFIDSNVPMYLVGASHPHKEAARLLLDRWINRGERMVTSAEVLQEIVHRYHSIKRPDAIQPAFDALLGVIDEVFAVELADVQRAKELLLGRPKLSSRDALHVAVMERREIVQVMSFDAGFDAVGTVERVS
jgi:predicted nucleic acid-binding protein